MWLMNGTAVQGRGHISEGVPCQDKIASKSNGKINVIALADGAGSAALSHIGAEKCVDTITQYFLDHFDDCYFGDEDSVKQRIYEVLIENLQQLAIDNECDIKDLASTLLCVAVTDDRVITLHLGDGIIAYYNGQSVKVYSAPDNGEFANVTHFVTSSNALSKIRIRKEVLSDATAFYLMSDGAGTSLYSPQQKAASNALKMMSDLSLLYSRDDVCEEITNFFTTSIGTKTLDDCSVVYMVKHKRTIDTFCQMSYNEQLDLLGIKRGTSHERKRYRRFCDVIRFCETERSLQAVSRRIGIKPKYGKKYVERLTNIGMLKKESSNIYVNANNASGY
jgi:hypothetical protein